MRPSRALALNVGSEHATCVRFRRAAGQLMIEESASEAFASSASEEVEWYRMLGAAVARLARRVPFHGEVRIAIPGHLALTKAVRTPAIGRSSRQRVIEFEAAQSIPFPLTEVCWDYLSGSEAGSDLELLLLATKREVVAQLGAITQEVGWQPAQALPACLALESAFRLNYPVAEHTALVVSIEARSTHIVMVGQGLPRVRTMTGGGDLLRHGCTQPAGDPSRETENKRYDAGRDTGTLVQFTAAGTTNSATERFATRLQLEITRALAEAEQQDRKLAVEALHLCGGCAQLAGLDRLLHEKLGLPVVPFDPLRHVLCRLPPEQLPSSLPGLAEAVGLVADLVEPSVPRRANLLPVVMQREAASRRRRPVLCVAGMLLAAALSMPIWRFHNEVVTTRAEIAYLDAELRPLRELAARRTEERAEVVRLQGRMDELQRLARAKTYWVRFLADLQDRLSQPEPVWLERLTFEASAAGTPGQPARSTGVAMVGHLLITDDASASAGAEAFAPIQRLLTRLAESPFVAVLSNERFDDAHTGSLRFQCTLALRSDER